MTNAPGRFFCFPPAEEERFVGDPVDVISGANSALWIDCELPGPYPFKWIRCYDSARNGEPMALGWGHSHDFDRRLVMDADGIRYASATDTIGFPPLMEDGAQAAAGGYFLRRLSETSYHMRGHGKAEMWFVFGSDLRAPAQLHQLGIGDHRITFHYEGGRLARMIDSRDRTILVTYDAAGRLSRLTLLGTLPNQSWDVLAYRYDTRGNLTQVVDSYGYSFAFEYDAAHRMTSYANRRGFRFTYEYDATGRCVRSRGDDGLFDVKLRYLPERATVVTRSDGGEWMYLYPEGHIEQIIDPYGGVRKFLADKAGNIAEEIDPNGNATKLVRDSSGAVLLYQPAVGQSAAARETALPVAEQNHPMPHCPLEWEFGEWVDHHAIHLPSADEPALRAFPAAVAAAVRTHSHPAAPAASSDYAAKGCWEAPGGEVYDERGLLVKHVHGDGSAHYHSHDPNRREAKHRDRDGSTSSVDSLPNGLPLREVDALGNAVAFEYDSEARVKAVVDGGGHRSDYEYDLKGRLVRVRRHGAVKEEYRYDAGDVLVEKRDQTGKVLFTCEVGPGNLIAKKTYASGEIHEFAYDQAGRYLAARAAGGDVAFQYDEFGHRVSDQRNGRGVTHQFDGARLVLTAVLERFVTKYEYDGPGSMTLIDPAGGRHRLQNLGHGLVLRTHSNRTNELSQYDPSGLCLGKQVWNTGKASTPWKREFRYSSEGHLREAADSSEGTSAFTHDAAHRLTGATLANGRKLEFEYDSASNLIRNGGGAAVRATLGTGNRIEAVATERFEYDHRNSVVSRGAATRYTYNERDMLVAWESGGRRVEFTHDALGRRIAKTTAEGTTQFYHYTDRLQAEVSPDGRLRVYVYANCFSMTPLMFIDYAGVDADPASGQRYFVFCDQRATPVAVQNDAGEVVWRAEVEPYGRAAIRPDAKVALNLRFPGHYFDPETGLHNNRFREYDPGLGRYLQSDPLGTAGAVNLYAYPADPLTMVDLRGEDCGGAEPNCPNPNKKAEVEKGTEAPKSSVPHGFADVGEFDQFATATASGLKGVAGEGAQAFLGGSAITGKKFTTGEPFDVGRKSDFDVALVGGDLMTKAKAAGIETRSKGTRTGPLSEAELKQLGLHGLAEDLSKQSGREVNFMLYESEEALKQRGQPYQELK